MDTLAVERPDDRPGLVIIRLNRPEKLNAINNQMHQELQDLCHQLTTDGDARVVVLTGNGRAFSAGADLGSAPNIGEARRAVGTRTPVAEAAAARIASTMGNRSSAALENLPQVTIGAINGLTVGGAVVFASCLDLRFAARSAWFSIPEVELDIPLTWNALPRLMREIGPARTKEMVMLCDRFSAEDAERWGFVNHVVEDGELMSRVLTTADRLLAMDPYSIAATKAATTALAQMMVPQQVTWSDPDLLMIGRGFDRGDAPPPGRA
ncbi:MAG: enoyl-CoA hydratase/isomerase family protein [Chloroflexi bacterium]|nr:enoyl-CoA hydratase/isomerase family protein [Chloroflexota bacterium]MDA1146867.1 enoyl-CoA hydratase/isomerase family protein [Chloroflexota bacterium]